MANFGSPTEQQLAKINKHAKVAKTADELFVFNCKLAGDIIIPERQIKLSKELLDVFALNAIEGRALMLAHSWSPSGLFGMGGQILPALPYGKLFDGKVIAANQYDGDILEGEEFVLTGDHYIVKDRQIHDFNTNEIIHCIGDGTWDDTSIGWGSSKFICSICGNNYNSRSCDHYRGGKYEVERNGETVLAVCYTTAYPPGYLMENSLVFDGAYPTAGVKMSIAEGDTFENKTGVFQYIEDLKKVNSDQTVFGIYNAKGTMTTFIKKSEPKTIYTTGIQIPEKDGGKAMDLKDLFTKDGQEKLNNGDKEAIALAIQHFSTPLELEPQILTVEALPIPFMSAVMAKEKLGTEYTAEQILSMANEGKLSKDSAITEATGWGIRALGEKFNKETWEKTLEVMSVKEIQDISENWKQQASTELTIGRKSYTKTTGNVTQEIPDEAFKMGGK